jgi:hypothetical protein
MPIRLRDGKSAIGCTQARFVMDAKRCWSNHALVEQRKSVSNCSSAIFRDLSFVCFADLANWHDRPYMRRAPTNHIHGAGKEGTCCALACRR